MRMRRIRKPSRFMWTCSACSTPRYWKETHVLKPCSKCGAALPSYHVFIDKYNREYTTHSRRSEVLSSEAKRLLRPHGVDVPSALRDISDHRGRTPLHKGDAWFTTIYLPEEKFQGELEFNTVLFYTPQRVRNYVAKTKMVQMRIPVELHKWFKRFSQEQDTTMTSLIIKHIQALQQKHKKTIDVGQI